jgi:RNA polymerase sigma-70 factor, ECF subfamily
MVENHVRNALVPLYPRLRRFAVALTGSSAEGDDLVQHACERALARTYQWHPGTRLDSWLYRIIQNTWADERKSARNRTQAPIEAATNAIGDDGVRRAEARLTLDTVYRELCNLPEEQRAVLMLVCVDGLTYKEVAEILSIPAGTVMSRVARGRLALADRIEASGAHSTDNILKLR